MRSVSARSKLLSDTSVWGRLRFDERCTASRPGQRAGVLRRSLRGRGAPSLFTAAVISKELRHPVSSVSSPAIQASWAPQRTAVVLHVNLLPSMLGVGSSTFGVCSPSLALRPSLPFSLLVAFSWSLVIRTWTFKRSAPLPWPALGVAHWPLGFAALVLAPGIHALRSDAIQAPRPVMRRPSMDRRSCLSFSIVRQTIAFPLQTRWFDVNVVSKFRRRGNIPRQTHRRACGEETTSYRSSIESFRLTKDA